MNNQLLRFGAVRQLVSLSRTTIWRLEREGKFPARRQLGSNSVAWIAAEVTAWVESRAIVERRAS